MVKNEGLKRICLIPNVSGVGGMVSFRGKLVKGLVDRGIEVSFDLADTPYDVVLIIGGTRALSSLWREKRRGVPVVQRLDGMNWIHRKRRTSVGHFMRAEYGNFILSMIRAHLADKIVYQSEFSRQWWERVYGVTEKPWQVVYNGVDLERYTPIGLGNPPGDKVRVLVVEGNIGGGYELGVQQAIQLGERLHSAYTHNVEVMVVGRISAILQREWRERPGIKVNFAGQVPADRIPEIDRSAHVLFAADLNPACPNSVVEALACGLPVVAFDTGAISEMITRESGQIVPYGGNPWELEPADIEGLAKAVNHVVDDQAEFRKSARRRAEEAFGLDRMVEGYLDALEI